MAGSGPFHVNVDRSGACAHGRFAEFKDKTLPLMMGVGRMIGAVVERAWGNRPEWIPGFGVRSGLGLG